MSNLIDRQAAIDDVILKLEYIMEGDPRTFSNPECEYEWVFHRINEVIKMLKEIEKDFPPAQPECKKAKLTEYGWIPCDERLPREAARYYLCSFNRSNRIDNYVGFAYWTGGSWYGYEADHIIAWMPLPSPYQEGAQE